MRELFSRFKFAESDSVKETPAEIDPLLNGFVRFKTYCSKEKHKSIFQLIWIFFLEPFFLTRVD